MKIFEYHGQEVGDSLDTPCTKCLRQIWQQLINVVKIFLEEHRENVLHSEALNGLKRISVCSKIEATSSTFYRMYFFLLIIKKPLFLNTLVYYFSFFVSITMNKEPLKISKMLKHNVDYARCVCHCDVTLNMSYAHDPFPFVRCFLRALFSYPKSNLGTSSE